MSPTSVTVPVMFFYTVRVCVWLRSRYLKNNNMKYIYNKTCPDCNEQSKPICNLSLAVTFRRFIFIISIRYNHFLTELWFAAAVLNLPTLEAIIAGVVVMAGSSLLLEAGKHNQLLLATSFVYFVLLSYCDSLYLSKKS